MFDSKFNNGEPLNNPLIKYFMLPQEVHKASVFYKVFKHPAG